MKKYIITLMVVTTIVVAINGVSNGCMSGGVGRVCPAPSSTETVVPATETVVPATETTSLERFVYTCPMHPEINLKKPGKCPKCKMNLEIKKIVPATETICPHDNTKLIKKGKKLYCPKCKMIVKPKDAKKKQ